MYDAIDEIIVHMFTNKDKEIIKFERMTDFIK